MPKIAFFTVILVIISTFVVAKLFEQPLRRYDQFTTDVLRTGEDEESLDSEPYHLTIDALRNGSYPGSEIVIEESLKDGSNYKRYLVSYRSEKLKIYALLTLPKGEKPKSGWPTIVFNHGYIPPSQYRTTERYVAYVDGFARNGYIVFRPDYRGHGNSEGEPLGAYGSNAYTIDVLNAVSSVKQYRDADPDRIGMWGHSMGGHITLRNMVVSEDVKAGVIWAGVVGSYPDLLNNWRRRNTTRPTVAGGGRRWRDQLVKEYGEPESNAQFWNSISATSYLTDISGPIQLHHGTKDVSVPVSFSENLHERLAEAGKISQLYTYQGDDHNITDNFNLAMSRSLDFFDTYLK